MAPRDMLAFVGMIMANYFLHYVMEHHGRPSHHPIRTFMANGPRFLWKVRAKGFSRRIDAAFEITSCPDHRTNTSWHD